LIQIKKVNVQHVDLWFSRPLPSPCNGRPTAIWKWYIVLVYRRVNRSVTNNAHGASLLCLLLSIIHEQPMRIRTIRHASLATTKVHVSAKTLQTGSCLMKTPGV